MVYRRLNRWVSLKNSLLKESKGDEKGLMCIKLQQVPAPTTPKPSCVVKFQMILWLNYDSRVCHRYMPDGHVRSIQYLYFFFFLIIKSHSNLGFVKNHKLLCLAIRVPPAQGLSALPDKNTIAAEWRFWSWPFMTGLESFEIGPRPGAVIFIEQNGWARLLDHWVEAILLQSSK